MNSLGVDVHIVSTGSPFYFYDRDIEVTRASSRECNDEVHQMTWKNACRLFSFDPFTARSQEKSTVGALREESPDVDLSPHSAGGNPAVDEKRPVTAADITKQLAPLYAPVAE